MATYKAVGPGGARRLEHDKTGPRASEGGGKEEALCRVA